MGYEKDVSILVMGRNAGLKCCYLTALFWDIYWKDCPFEKILCTQTQIGDCEDKYDRFIYTDEKLIWGDRLEKALQEIDTEYVIMMPEDFFICKTVDTKSIYDTLLWAKENNAGAIHLTPPVLFSKRYSKQLREIKKGMLYRMALWPVLYKTEYLKRFAGIHLSPWQFERVGTEMSNDFDEKVFCTVDNIYPCVHAWGHNSWTRGAMRLMKKNHIPEVMYCNDSVYPIRLVLFNMFFFVAVKLFPNTVNKMALRKAQKGEKKLKK